MEVVTAVASSGVAAGLAVLIAQTPPLARQQLFLRRALALGLAVCAPVALAAAIAGWSLSDRLGGGSLAPQTAALAALAGWIAVIHVLVNHFWLGQQRRDLMLGLAFVSAALALAAATFAPQALVMELVIAAPAAPAAVLCLVRYRAEAAARSEDRALERYILPGLAIGILSPLSLIFARSVVADSLSWHEAGVLQGLWRISDWIGGLAGGLLSVLYLPRFAAAYAQGASARVLGEAMRTVLAPSALLLLLLLAFHRPLLEALYDTSFQASPQAAALLFAGSALRIAAWIPLVGLYAAGRTRAIAVGELLSLPLFAALAWLAADRLTLELVGLLWLTSFGAYAAFNLWALRRT